MFKKRRCSNCSPVIGMARRVRAGTDRWQDRLEEQQQDVETEQAKMTEAVAGIID